MNTDSQRLQIQRFLATGAAITPLMAFKRFNTLSLSQRIGELKREGWPIVSRMVKVGEKRVASYRIDRSKS